jgi:hypothetical protein
MMIRITGLKHAQAVILGFAIRQAGNTDAQVRAEIDGGVMVYQGPAHHVARLVTGGGLAAIRGRKLSLSIQD